MEFIRIGVLLTVIVFGILERDSVANLIQWCQKTPVSAGVIIGGIVFLLVSYTWKLARKKK